MLLLSVTKYTRCVLSLLATALVQNAILTKPSVHTTGYDSEVGRVHPPLSVLHKAPGHPLRITVFLELYVHI